MSFATMHIAPGLIARADRFGTDFNAARMGALEALPGDPYGAEVRLFGEGIAAKARHPLLASKNRILGFRSADLDLLDDLLRFYREEGLAFTLTVPPGEMTLELFQRLVRAGLWSSGSGTVPALVPGDSLPDVPQISVRQSGPEEKELYLDLFQQAFADREERTPEYRDFQWAEDSLPGGIRCIAEIAGKPVGMASFPVVNGIGYFGTAGVVPDYRRRGVQKALIHRRIAEAAGLGCDLILAGGSPGTSSYRNFERAGMKLIPTGSVWQEGF